MDTYEELQEANATCVTNKELYAGLDASLEHLERRRCIGQGIDDPNIIQQRVRKVKNDNEILKSYANKYEFANKEVQRLTALLQGEFFFSKLVKEATREPLRSVV
jgi:hypothetical protein